MFNNMPGGPTLRQIVAQLQAITSSLERIVTSSDASFDITAFTLDDDSVQFAPAAMLSQSYTMNFGQAAVNTSYQAVVDVTQSLERGHASTSNENEVKLNDSPEVEHSEQEMVRCPA